MTIAEVRVVCKTDTKLEERFTVDIHKVIDHINHLFNLWVELALVPPLNISKIEQRQMKLSLSILEHMLIADYEEPLREELETEIRELRPLSISERAIWYFASPRYSVAILLIKKEV